MDITIYTGKYQRMLVGREVLDRSDLEKIKDLCVIELPKAKLRVYNRYNGVSEITGETSVDNRVTLVVHDGNFWPYICKMDKEEATGLRDALDAMINSDTNRTKSISIPEEEKYKNVELEDSRESGFYTRLHSSFPNDICYVAVSPDKRFGQVEAPHMGGYTLDFSGDDPRSFPIGYWKIRNPQDSLENMLCSSEEEVREKEFAKKYLDLLARENSD